MARLRTLFSATVGGLLPLLAVAAPAPPAATNAPAAAKTPELVLPSPSAAALPPATYSSEPFTLPPMGPTNPPADAELHPIVELHSLYNEGLFEKADAAAKAFLARFPTSPLRADAHLVQGQALYFLGRYDAALAALGGMKPVDIPPALAADYYFWQGEALTRLERWPEAEKSYRDALSRSGDSATAPAAQLGLAWALDRQGNPTDARALLAALMQATPPTEAGEKAALVLAKIDIADDRLDDASATLDGLLARKVRPGTAFEANYWRGEIAQLRQKYAEAAKDYQVVTGNPKAFPRDLVAKAWFGLGSAEQKLNHHEEALAAFEQAFTIGRDDELRLTSFRLYLRSAQALQRLPEAQAKLRAFAKGDSSPVTAAASLFAIASSEAANQAGDEAVGTLEALLTAYPQTIWRGAAFFQLGQLYADKGKADRALASFQSCLESAPPAALNREAEFRIGKIYFAQGNFAKAGEAFRLAAADPSPLAEKALFNLLLSQAQEKNLDLFLKTAAEFEKAFPQSGFLGQVTLERARLYQAAGKSDDARATYQEALQRITDPAQKPPLLLRIADLDRDAGRLDDALRAYEEIINEHPEDPRLPEAAYDALTVRALTGKLTPEQARDGLLQLAKKFEKSPLAPTILFSAGETAYNQQDYVGAQTTFERLADRYPQADPLLVNQALYLAGDSAVLLGKDYGAAIHILERIPENAPDNLKTEARLLQGLIYYKQGKFENAVALFDVVLSAEKGGPLFVAATLRKGTALYALGAADPARYEQAANAYGTLLSGGQGNFAQRNEAAYMRAKCFEKLKRPDDALNLYVDVLNGRTMPADNKDPLPPEMLWRVKAGLDAAEIRKQKQEWRGAVDIYRRLENLGGPNQAEFRDDINRLRREHFLFDDEETQLPEIPPPAATAAPVPAAAPVAEAPKP